MVQPYSKIRLVVAHYNEPLSWIQRCPYQYTIYNKGNPLPNTISLPNIGREAHTYLHHIITNWDRLDRYTAFLQGYPLDHASELFVKFHHFSQSPRNFLHLCDGHGLRVSDSNGAPEQPGIAVGAVADSLGISREQFPFGAGAQFIVSRERIRSRPLEFYVRMMDILKQNPDAPWIYERLWETVFNT